MCSVNYACANIPTRYIWGWTFVHTCVWMDVGAAVTQYNWACMGCQTIQDFTAVPHSTHSVGPGVWVAGAMSDLI